MSYNKKQQVLYSWWMCYGDKREGGLSWFTFLRLAGRFIHSDYRETV